MYEPFAKIQKHVPGYKFEVVFDVGAHVGNLTKQFYEDLPLAKILAFEPVQSTFDAACAQTVDCDRVTVLNLALGSAEGTAHMRIGDNSEMNRVDRRWGDQVVRMSTIDHVCSGCEIYHISYLKIDTEGYELEVLKGAAHMLENIDFVECEVSLNRYNKYHVSYDDVNEFLQPFGFGVFHLFEQTMEWIAKAPILRRANVVFVSPRIYGNF
ncbi:FkbM family methyltransferase [Ensifer adhaerens]|uniref:FkbM family methyltransferase n=1 Tax=Ensifer adhaerens TaxID=106592 RepID=UPI003F83E9C7